MTPERPSAVDLLLAQARAGDPRAVDALFEACREYLGQLARAQLESRLRAKVDASDLIQETLLDAHRDFAKFRGSTHAEWLAWLRQILSHNTADCARFFFESAKRRAGLEVPIRAGDDSSRRFGADEPNDPGETPSQSLIREEDQQQVANALALLPADYRQVIVLRNLERLPFDVVADRMGRSRPAVQMLWMRAISKLQQALS